MAIRFKGFSTASAVALGVTAGGETRNASVATWGQPSGGGGGDEVPATGPAQGTVTIDVLRETSALGIAPYGIFIDIRVTSPHVTDPGNFTSHDETFAQKVFYRTDWGEGAAVASDKVVNLPAGHNNLNLSYGKRVGHVYSSPGSYTVTVDAWGDDGAGGIEYLGQDTHSVTVSAVAAVFSGANEIILVDPAGAGDSATYPNSRVETSLDAAMGYYFGNSGKRAILLKAGISENALDRYALTAEGNKPLHFGAYGGGARPVINLSTASGDSAFIYVGGPGFTGSLTLQGIALQGPWNEVAESGGGEGRTGLLLNGQSDLATVIDDVTFNGCLQAIWTPDWNTATSTRAATWVNNSDIANWQYYAIYSQTCQGNIVCLTGTEAARSPDAAGGGSNSQNANTSNAGGVYRSNFGGLLYFAGNDFFNNAGWPLASGLPADYNIIRFNAAHADGASAVIERNAFEGGVGHLEWAYANVNGGQGTTRPVTNTLFERNLSVSSAATGSFYSLEQTSFCSRNNLLVKPNQPRMSLSPHPSNYEFIYSLRNNRASNGSDIALIYNDTIVNLLNSANAGGDDYRLFDAQSSDWVGLVSEDILYLCPNDAFTGETDTDLSADVLATAGGTWTARYDGFQWSGNSYVKDTSFATPGGSVAEYRLQTGANTGIGDAAQTYLNIWDFNGKVRTRADRGAVEYAA